MLRAHAHSSANRDTDCPKTPALRRDNVPPGLISVLLVKTPRPEEDTHLERMPLRRLTEDDVPHLGSASLEDMLLVGTYCSRTAVARVAATASPKRLA